MEIRSVDIELFRTERLNEVDSHFSQICERA